MEITTFIWMFLVLKIPIVAALVLIWWAVKEPEPVGAEGDDGGSKQPDRPHGPRTPPRPPRRGPHTRTPPPAPPRVRTAAVGRRADTPR